MQFSDEMLHHPSRVPVWRLNSFFLVIDDSGLQKWTVSLTVGMSDVNRSWVTTQLLGMCLTSSFTAESVYSKVDDTLKQFNIDWKICIAFSVHNTSINPGSIKTHVLHENPSTYVHSSLNWPRNLGTRLVWNSNNQSLGQRLCGYIIEGYSQPNK